MAYSIATRDRAWNAIAVDTIILAITLVPLVVTAHVPLSDLPNHLARQYVIQDLANSPALQKFYEVHWALVPNLALELFVLAVRWVVDISLAVRLFCIATVILIFLGTRFLSISLGHRSSRAYRLAPLVIYGGPFQFGFLSYCFGIGLALLLFGLYLRLRNVSLPWLIAIFVPAGAVLLLCHIAAFGLYAVAVGCYELDQALGPFGRDSLASRIWPVVRAEMRAACQLVPPLILFLALGPPGNAAGIRWGGLHEKLESIAAVTVFSSPGLELALLGLMLVGLAAALITGVVRVPRCMVFVLAGLTVIWLVLPRSAFGGGYLDYRLPWAAAFFLLAGLAPGSGSHRVAAALGQTFAVVSVLRIAMITGLWLSWEPIIAQIDNSFDHLPVGATMMVVVGRPPSTSAARSPSLLHVAAYAVARRQAFEPNIYADISGQILRLKPPYAALRFVETVSDLDRINPLYTHLLVLRPNFAHISPDLNLTLIDSGQLFALYEVRHDRSQ